MDVMDELCKKLKKTEDGGTIALLMLDYLSKLTKSPSSQSGDELGGAYKASLRLI